MVAAPLVALMALVIRPSPVAPGLPVGAAAQWTAVSAVARVTGGINAPVGSAVCVGIRDSDAYLLTAAHVVPPGGAREYQFFTRDSYPAAAWSVVGGDVVWRSAAIDAALIRVHLTDHKPGVAPLAAPLDRPKQFPVLLWAVGCPAGIAPACRPEKVVGRPIVTRPRDESAFFWQTQTAATGGMSGGPMLDAKGRVIGVCAAASGGGGYYAHHDEILVGLKLAGYGWLAQTP